MWTICILTKKTTGLPTSLNLLKVKNSEIRNQYLIALLQSFIDKVANQYANWTIKNHAHDSDCLESLVMSRWNNRDESSGETF